MLTKVRNSMISGSPVNVVDFGADPTGVSDSAAAFTAALAASNSVFIPVGTFLITSAITLPPYAQVIGSGINNTTITATGDNVAFVLQFWSQLRELKVVKAGTHTKNLIEVGSATLDAGRAVISDVWVQGAGGDGIQLIYGNLGLLQNVVSILNGLNGIRFLAGNGDLNAWTLQGYIDVRGNGNDGLRIEAGASIGDPLCSKSNFITGVIAQENSQYGVFIGTRSNLVSCYAEANTVGEVQLGTYARGNEINTTEGSVVDSSSNPSFNIVYNNNASGGYQRVVQNRLLFSGVTAAGLQLYNDDGATGTLTFNKIGTNQYQLSTGDSAAAHRMFFNSSDGATTWEFKGHILPFTDNTFNLGSASFRWDTVFAATGTINTSDENSKTDIRDISDAEKSVASAIKSQMKAFKFSDAVALKGSNARIHFGVIAQTVRDAFLAEGLDPTSYGVFCSDTWTDESGIEQTRLGVRYDELFAFIISTL
jgi:hypothetical protein